MIIGEKIINQYGEIEYEKGKTAQGMVYKDYNAFKNKTNDICYIPEIHDYGYTYNNILDECLGNEKLAEEVFNVIDWQSPYSYINDLICSGNVIEKDNKYYFNSDGDNEEWEPNEEYL